METNEQIQMFHELETRIWITKLSQARESGNLRQWVSTFHPDGLICRVEEGLYHGSFNIGSKVTFADGTSWLVRFPIVGNVSEKYADEKIAMEVETLCLIREKTTIPVPTVRAWGIAASNTLGLGPFIIMDFIEGVGLHTLLQDPNKQFTRLMRDNISHDDVEVLYRQIAKIFLQLFQLNFDRIGCLPTIKTGFARYTRPLTFKIHDILQTGGVDCFGDRHAQISTTLEYFQYIATQDWRQLQEQANSVAGEHDAKAKYTLFSTLDSLLPQFIHDEYNNGPFKLLCDDLGLANLIVRNENDLTVVGVVDLEWSYIGPAQMFASPWWLLQGRLNIWSTKFDENPKAIADRFAEYLAIFLDVLKQEEEKTPEGKKELYELVRWSLDSGAIWLHMLLSCGFNFGDSLPFTSLQKHVGPTVWGLHEKKVNEMEASAFGQRKALQLAQYDRDLESVALDFETVGRGHMTAEEFFSQHRSKGQ